MLTATITYKGKLDISGHLIEVWADSSHNTYHRSDNGEFIALKLYLELNNLSPIIEEIINRFLKLK